MHVRRLVVNDKGERQVNCMRINDVVVIHDQDELLWQCRDFVEQVGQSEFEIRRLQGLKRSQRLASKVRPRSFGITRGKPFGTAQG
jgi:hypothetical protein